ncbi:Ig-like domain repeat protein, partial [Spirillospora sp. NPDC049652]
MVADPVAGHAAAAAAPTPVAPVNSALATGYNFNGQLGNGTTSSRDTPGPVILPEGVTLTNIDAGDYHNLAVTSGGRVLGWGQNAYGELGNGSTAGIVDVPVYADLPAGVTVTQVSGGYHHSLAVTSDGRVLAWGYNGYGELGDGTTESRTVPVEVHLPQGVTVKQVSAGYMFSLALTTDGRVLAWGYNNYGKLGNGTTTDSRTPVQVALPSDLTIKQVAAGDNHGLALTTSSRVWGWGLNQFGELGTNPLFNNLPVQVPMPGGDTLTQIAAGDRNSMAVTSDGRVLAWGQNNAGKLGDGTTTNRDTPVEVVLPDGVKVTQVDTGVFHSAAVTSDGRALGWGTNSDGELGDGTTTPSLTPVFMLLPEHTTAVQITVGRYHTAMLAERASSHTSLTADPTHAAPGQEITLTARVTCSVGDPTGLVTFWDGDQEIGTAEVNAEGVATFTTTDLAEGQHHITAHYRGDDTCPPSTSEAVTVTVSAEPTHAGLHLTKEFAGFVGPGKPKTHHKAKHRHEARLSAWHDHDAVRYRFIVTNDGDVPISNITIHDSRTGTVTCTTDTLEPGQSATCYAVHKVTPKEKSRGYVDNTATATGTRRDDGETVTSNRAYLRVDLTYK